MNTRAPGFVTAVHVAPERFRVVVLCILLVPAFALGLCRGTAWEGARLNMHRLPRDPWFALAVLAGPAYWAALWWQDQLAPGWPPAWTGLIVVALAYPVIEEIVFRGMLQEWLWRRTQGQRLIGPVTLANALAASAFALAHLVSHAPAHALGVLLPGLVFGFFRDRYHSILPGTLLHCFYNGGLYLLTAG